jgi:indolepyruvate decarboxylase
MTLSEALLRALKDRGARQIFGIPGDFSLPFFKVVEESEILPLYTLSHEPAVGFAADAAARVNSCLGVAAVTYGAGAFNMVNAVAAAYAEKSPVVVISSAPGTEESNRGLLLHHQAKALDSQFKVYENITCAQARLDDPARAPAKIDAVLTAAAEQSMPVYIEMPRDLATAPCGEVPARRPEHTDPDALAACAEEVLDRLGKAERPVFMAGVELRRYGLEDKAAELARRLAIPVVTSFMGRGLLAKADPPARGTYLGLAGEPELTRLVEDSDALLLLGVIPSDTNFGVSERQIDARHTIHAFDRQVKFGYHEYPRIPLAALLGALLERAPATAPCAPAVDEPKYPRGLVADDGAVSPPDIARAVNDLMDAHGTMPIAADMGDCLFTAMDMARTELVAPGYYAGMGFGVPAGIGLQIATGQRPLILVGDGAFQMTGWELGNCQRYGLDPIVIVFNNRSWDMLRVFQPDSRFNDLDDWHFAEIAGPLGGVGARVTTRAELKAALDTAVATPGRFYLVEVMIERGVISDTLARFVGAVSRLREPG